MNRSLGSEDVVVPSAAFSLTLTFCQLLLHLVVKRRGYHYPWKSWNEETRDTQSGTQTSIITCCLALLLLLLAIDPKIDDKFARQRKSNGTSLLEFFDSYFFTIKFQAT